MGPSLIEIDHGWKALTKALEQLRHGDAYVKAGMIGEKAAKVEEEHEQSDGAEPLTNVQLLAIHEFGAPSVGIPERSVVRSTFDKNRAAYVEQLRALVKGVYTGKTTVRRILGLMGLKMSWDQKNAILEGAGIPPPLSDATIAAKERKGRWNKAAAKDPARPLVDFSRQYLATEDLTSSRRRERRVGCGDQRIGAARR